jgi:uncharacterized protein YyaL (SSP411 family)
MLLKAVVLVLVLCLALFAAVLAGCTNNIGGNTNTGTTVNWLVDQDQALLEAQSQSKPILINFYTDACPACRQMDRTTFVNKDVIELLNSNFTNLRSNAGKTPLYRNYGVSKVPTFVFTTPDGYSQDYVITKAVGYRNADQFYVLAQAVLDTWKSQNPA